ncbi:ABC transporter permease [Halioglobus pacificus]|uniref:Iron export ABC transporter permease subunit FetB n=1 Tax=Parahalioglobus pacificus TaxID=930806 RepID=A0A919CIK3_9GAMM|nr:ABC transporter permease [Halioglobus pacificus]GHD28779.1 iron export ABC transporter permease subunit FetB [Halioglobus pacificus]
MITLDLSQLALSLVPAILTLFLLLRWSMSVREAIYALLRMLLQLLVAGYALAWIFGAGSGALILLVLAAMVTASAWISLRTVPEHRRRLLLCAFGGVLVGGGLTLLFVTQVVLRLEPWYLPNYMIPLAGMALANAMTSISLAAERFFSELSHGVSWEAARIKAFETAMIPVINSLFAVGLVSLPGMMTGQILSGISPLIAARYQIMVMCMLFASSGLATAVFLSLSKRALADHSRPGS